MNVFIDCGAYDGDSIEEFRNWRKVSFPDKEDWTIHAFEPNPKFDHNLKKKGGDKTFIHKQAVWIEDTNLEFAVDQTDTPLGSTLMSGKKNIWDSSPKIKVEAIDFSSWIKQFKDDFVVVKIDCEGAEFAILEKMIKDKTINIPHLLMVEFHPNKVREYTTTYTNELKQRIKELGVNLVDWH